MPETQALQLAADMAKRQRDDAARLLAQRHGQKQSATQQLQQLLAYAQETREKWIARRSPSDSAVLYHHAQFLEKLQQAIDYQHQVIEQHDDQIAQAQADLVEAEHNLERFAHVIKTRRAELARQQDRQAQKQMDEMATQMTLRRLRRVKEKMQ